MCMLYRKYMSEMSLMRLMRLMSLIYFGHIPACALDPGSVRDMIFAHT